MMYEEQWCSQCIHRNGGDGKSGCPIWLAHLLYAYEECNSKSNAKAMLDLLIPMEEHTFRIGNKKSKCHFPAQCSMFTPGKPVPEEEESHSNIGKPKVMPAMHEWAKQRGLPVS